jgi:hypothetical protein
MARSKTDKQMAIDLILEHTQEAKRVIANAREEAFTQFEADTLASASVQKLWEKYQTLDTKVIAANETLEKLRKEQHETLKNLQKLGATVKTCYGYREDEDNTKLPILETLDGRYGSASPMRKKFDDSRYAAKCDAIDVVEREARTAIITSGAAEFGLVLADVIAKLKSI